MYQMKHILLWSILLFIVAGCHKGTEEDIIPFSVTGMSPSVGGYNTLVTITGTKFSLNPAENKVTFNGVEGIVQNCTETSITVLVPESVEGNLSVKVTTPSGTSNELSFKYTYTVYALVNEFYQKDSQGDDIYIPKCYKNGVATALTDGTYNANVNAITVVGNDVYAVGEYWGAKGWVIAYWKNGVRQNLTTGDTSGAKGNAIVVKDNNVYVAGYEGAIAEYWKNGTLVVLTDGTNFAQAKGIAVDGSDVYVVGYEYNGQRHSVAKYWKNGIAYTLSTNTNNSASEANGIAIYNHDIYIVGGDNGPGWVAKYWKNGVGMTLSASGVYSEATNIVVSNSGKIIACGKVSATKLMATIWSNGSMTYLNDVKFNADANGICVANSDIFVAGCEVSANYILVAKYWKNGIPINLSDGTKKASAVAICVK